MSAPPDFTHEIQHTDLTEVLALAGRVTRRMLDAGAVVVRAAHHPDNVLRIKLEGWLAEPAALPEPRFHTSAPSVH